MRLFAACLLAFACEPAESPPPPPIPVPPPPKPAPKPRLHVESQSQTFEPRHAIAYTRGGEAIVLALGTMPMPCESRHGLSARDKEKLILFELTRQVYDSGFPDRGNATLATAPYWRLTGISLIDYPSSLNSNMLSEDGDAFLVVPDGLTTRGGRLRVRYRGVRFLYADPNEMKTEQPVVVDGEIDVRACGDLPEVDTSPSVKSTLTVTIGPRTFPIRAALANRRDGFDHIVLSTLPRTCKDSGKLPGDLAITFWERDSSHTDPKTIEVSGTLSRDRKVYRDTSKRTPARIPATGRFELAIDVDPDPFAAPITIHGQITAERCKD